MEFDMPEQEQHRVSHRFSITQQYGLVGWVVLATIVVVGFALIGVSASTGNVVRRSVDGGLQRSANVVCTVSGDASGAMNQSAFFDDPLRQLGQCP